MITISRILPEYPLETASVTNSAQLEDRIDLSICECTKSLQGLSNTKRSSCKNTEITLCWWVHWSWMMHFSLTWLYQKWSINGYSFQKSWRQLPTNVSLENGDLQGGQTQGGQTQGGVMIPGLVHLLNQATSAQMTSWWYRQRRTISTDQNDSWRSTFHRSPIANFSMADMMQYSMIDTCSGQ